MNQNIDREKIMIDNADQKDQLCQYCTFWLSGRLFGINILEVNEINNEILFTSIMHAPKTVSGYLNIRGQIYLVADLRLTLGFKSKELDESSRVVIFKPAIGDSMSQITTSVGQQNRAANDISSNVAQAAQGANLVASSIAEIAKCTADMSKEATAAAKNTDEIVSNMQQVSTVATENKEFIEIVNTETESLSNISDSLSEIVNKFTVK